MIYTKVLFLDVHAGHDPGSSMTSGLSPLIGNGHIAKRLNFSAPLSPKKSGNWANLSTRKPNPSNRSIHRLTYYTH